MRGAKRVAIDTMAQLLPILFGSLPTFERPLPTTRSSRVSKFLPITLIAFGALGASSYIAIHQLPWFGPFVADTLRATIGSENVTWLEEVVADAEDQVKLATSSEIRELSDAVPSSAALPAQEMLRTPVVNRPRDVGPLHRNLRGAEDGVWQSVAVRGSEEPVLHRTLIHPDSERKYAELFVFALDLDKVSVHAVAGSIEPKRDDERRKAGDRPGVIPEEHRQALLAAFNGGFKAQHGQYGMMSDGVTWLPPKNTSCTFASSASGDLRISSWSALKEDSGSLAWWRQTPSCMIEDGKMHAGLRHANAKGWGATLEGDTVIRRSAVGLSENGKILFVGISNSTTASALAHGMAHAGATNVAQLDVNFSYPRFLLYREAQAAESGLLAEGAVKGLLYEDGEYLERASTRDFFYVTLKDTDRAEASR